VSAIGRSERNYSLYSRSVSFDEVANFEIQRSRIDPRAVRRNHASVQLRIEDLAGVINCMSSRVSRRFRIRDIWCRPLYLGKLGWVKPADVKQNCRNFKFARVESASILCYLLQSHRDPALARGFSVCRAVPSCCSLLDELRSLSRESIVMIRSCGPNVASSHQHPTTIHSTLIDCFRGYYYVWLRKEWPEDSKRL